MADARDAVLPYRTDPADLLRLVDARNRGRSLEQVRALIYSRKNFEGSLAAAQALGLLDPENGQLTAAGRRLALATSAEQLAVLLEILQRYEPYGLLLEAIFSRGEPGTTEAGWIERWWAAHGYGSSESNRAEGAATLARFLEHLGLAQYRQGRRGHPTRLEWRAGAALRLQGSEAAAPPPGPGAQSAPPPVAPRAAPPPSNPEPEPAPPAPPAQAGPDAPALSVAAFELGAGLRVRLELPAALGPAEKRRLLALVDLLVREDDAL